MAVYRIANVPMAPNKHVRIALQAIFGIGDPSARKICANVRIDPASKVKDLLDESLAALQKEVEKYKVEGDLRREVGMHIKRLIDIKCYRGMRHKRGLPVRGQRTKTNARTRKGRKRQSGVK